MENCCFRLDLARSFPSVETINLGGGYKVARMPNEQATDLQEVGTANEGFIY